MEREGERPAAVILGGEGVERELGLAEHRAQGPAFERGLEAGPRAHGLVRRGAHDEAGRSRRLAPDLEAEREVAADCDPGRLAGEHEAAASGVVSAVVDGGSTPAPTGSAPSTRTAADVNTTTGKPASKRPPEHAQPDREPAEAARLVERQRGRVVELRVDERRSTAAGATHRASAMSVRAKPRHGVGVDGDALRYLLRPDRPVTAYAVIGSLAPGATRKRATGRGASASTSLSWSRRQSPSKAVAPRSRIAGGRDGGRAGRSRRRRQLVEVVGEQVETLSHGEPGVDERRRVRLAERARHDRLVAASLHLSETALDHGRARRSIRPHREAGDVGVGAERPDTPSRPASGG